MWRVPIAKLSDKSAGNFIHLKTESLNYSTNIGFWCKIVISGKTKYCVFAREFVFGVENMENKDILIKFLKNHNAAYCDDCLAELTGISPRQQVNQICNKNRAIFERRRDLKCHNCNKLKITRSLKK